jgi:hypothetical protein
MGKRRYISKRGGSSKEIRHMKKLWQGPTWELGSTSRFHLKQKALASSFTGYFLFQLFCAHCVEWDKSILRKTSWHRVEGFGHGLIWHSQQTKATNGLSEDCQFKLSTSRMHPVTLWFPNLLGKKNLEVKDFRHTQIRKYAIWSFTRKPSI